MIQEYLAEALERYGPAAKILGQYGPQAFRTDRPYTDTFDHKETEASAIWIVRFLRARGSWWEPFRVEELQAFYEEGRGRQEVFLFNRLDNDTHVYNRGLGDRGQARHEQCVDIEGSSCRVRPAFVRHLLRNRELLEDWAVVLKA